MRNKLRAIAVGTAATLGVLTAAAIGAAPASAMNPCDADNPPDYCYTEPDPAPPAPLAPSNLTAPSILQTSVTLQWTDNATTETSYVIQRSPYNMATTVLTAPANSTSFTDTGAPAGRWIDYYVSARRCDSLTGQCSTSASVHIGVNTHQQPANPTGHVTANDWGTFYLSGWAIDYDTTGPLQVQVVTDGTVQSQVTASAVSSGLNASYPGYGDNHGFSMTATKSTAKGTHSLCVNAVNVGGGNDVNLYCTSYTIYGPPSAATNLRYTNTGTSIVVSFTDNANDETGYWLQRSTDGGASWLSVGSQYAAISGSGSTGTATDYSSPPAGTQYRILTINSYGNTPSAAITV